MLPLRMPHRLVQQVRSILFNIIQIVCRNFPSHLDLFPEASHTRSVDASQSADADSVFDYFIEFGDVSSADNDPHNFFRHLIAMSKVCLCTISPYV